MNENIRLTLLALAALVTISLFAYGGYHLKRWFHYSFSYQDKVIETIEDRVKPECLKK